MVLLQTGFGFTQCFECPHGALCLLSLEVRFTFSSTFSFSPAFFFSSLYPLSLFPQLLLLVAPAQSPHPRNHCRTCGKADEFYMGCTQSSVSIPTHHDGFTLPIQPNSYGFIYIGANAHNPARPLWIHECTYTGSHAHTKIHSSKMNTESCSIFRTQMKCLRSKMF